MGVIRVNMLLYKNVIKQVMKNRIFVFLLLILTLLTSLSYFFVQFSIDGNMDIIKDKTRLLDNEILWENALKSNTSLANIFLLATTLLTSFVFFMFYYRFFRANKTQLGCIKALGMRDRELLCSFLLFSIVISLLGGVFGIVIGYFLSEVLLQAYIESYSIIKVVKGIHTCSLMLGLFVPILAYCTVSCLSFWVMIKGREPGALIAGRVPYKKLGMSFHIADILTKLIPAKEKFPFRIALRKPVAVIIMVFSIMFFQVCMILGQSLNLSSQKIYKSQMQGHDYEYDIRFDTEQQLSDNAKGVPYLYQECEVLLENKTEGIQQTMIGLYEDNNSYIPMNLSEEIKSVPINGAVYISAGLADMYKVHIGDKIVVNINSITTKLEVADILANANTASIYCNADELSILIGFNRGSYNGLWSKERIAGSSFSESREQRIERLERDAVSNKLSAVINQITGAVVGMILLFLAMFLNFQDNQRDMDILRMIGYQNKEIRRLFIDIYWPIMVTFFVLVSIPSIILTRTIQRGLSLSIGDYMPFGVNWKIVVFMFLVMNILYGCVWCIFKLKK